MTAPIVQADYERLSEIASRFGQASERCAALEQRVQAAFGPLADGGWLGRGNASFCAEMDAVLFPAAQRLVAALDAAREVTLQIRATLFAAEQEAAASEFAAAIVPTLLGASRPAAALIGAMMKGVALNGLLPGRYVLRSITQNAARGQTTVAAVMDMLAGNKGRGLPLVRFDGPHRGAMFPHINLNRTLTGRPDPHLPISPRLLRAAGAGARLLEGGRRIAIPVAVGVDIFRLGSAFHADGNQVGEQTRRTVGSVAGGWAGAAVGAKIGAAGGVAIGGAIGSVIPVAGTAAGAGVGGVIGGLGGAIAGGIGGSWLGETIGGLF